MVASMEFCLYHEKPAMRPLLSDSAKLDHVSLDFNERFGLTPVDGETNT